MRRPMGVGDSTVPVEKIGGKSNSSFVPCRMDVFLHVKRTIINQNVMMYSMYSVLPEELFFPVLCYSQTMDTCLNT